MPWALLDDLTRYNAADEKIIKEALLLEYATSDI
jgi:hypothetical protein